MLYFTQLLNLPVLAEGGQRLGRLKELVLEPDKDSNRIRMLIYQDGQGRWQVPVEFAGVDLESVQLERVGAAPVPVDANSTRLLLRRDVLDQQIIDVNGRKVLRVNDVGLELSRGESGAELRAQSVEVGLAGAMRRLLQGGVPRGWLAPLSEWAGPHSIPWAAFDLVETDPARRMRLQITYERLGQIHPADAADIVEELAPAEREAIFNMLDSESAAEILGEVGLRYQREVLDRLDTERAADIVEQMDPDEAADLVQRLPAKTSGEILERMEAEEREEVSDLLAYERDTAGGLMTTDFVAVDMGATVGDAIAALRSFEGEVDSINVLLLVDADELLTGVVPLARLLLAAPTQRLAEIAAEPITVERDSEQREVAERFDKYNLLALPVVDEAGKLVGVVTVDDILAWLRSRR